jgi:hypothetical protein
MNSLVAAALGGAAAAGVNVNTRGFCKHRQPAFGPWHRAYMKMYENALIEVRRSLFLQTRV